jgi:thiol-disulfide isomerase/thioredoxin
MSAPAPDERPQRRREYSGAGSTLGVAFLVVVTVGLAVWFFELRGDNGPGGEGDGRFGIVAFSPGANPTDDEPAAQEGRAAPGFVLADLAGAEVSLEAFRGNYVLLNFWATWCPPCRAETPDLQAFHEAHEGRGWMVVGVNQQEEAGRARAFLDPFGVTYPQLLDSDGEVSIGYRVGRGLPVTFLIDPAGVIQKVHIGRLTAGQLEAMRLEFES